MIIISMDDQIRNVKPHHHNVDRKGVNPSRIRIAITTQHIPITPSFIPIKYYTQYRYHMGMDQNRLNKDTNI